MKLAIVHQYSSVGGWKYLDSLISGIKKVSPETDLTLFYYNHSSCPFPIKEFYKYNIVLKKIPYLPIPFKNKFRINILNRWYHKFRTFKQTTKLFKKKSHFNVNQELNNYDAVFYSWPYYTKAPDIKVPLFFIPHDFIFTHFFGHHGGNEYSSECFNNIQGDLATFMKIGVPIVSSEYIATELQRTFPQYNKKVNIVYLPKMHTLPKLAHKDAEIVLKKFDINFDYILLPTNSTHHKNMGQVLGAYYYVKQKYPNIKLIIIGQGTQGIRALCNTPYYCDHVNDNQPYDVRSLGLINDEEFTALMQNAKLIVNASLCEAGCGSGLDAWNLEIPLAISNIPPFLQQIQFLGTKAETFDPRNSTDIANAILRILDNPQIAKENAQISKKMIDAYTTEDFAKHYLEIFQTTQHP